MAFYQLIKTQKIHVTFSEVWDFISVPANLKKITPDHMGFIIISDTGKDKMYPGYFTGKILLHEARKLQSDKKEKYFRH